MRFPGFEEEWERRKLGEIAYFSKGKGISKIDIDHNGITECIRYGELYTHYGEVITEIKSKTNIDIATLVFSEPNDIIIPSSGETQIDIATASCVLKSGVALGGDLNIIRTPNNGVFFSYYLNSKKKTDIASLAQGISVVHLYVSQLESLEICLPSLTEQDKVASFLSSLDERIRTQIKIIEALKSLKVALAKKIFSQQLRFKNEKGCDFPEWEVKMLKDVATKKSSNISASSLEGNSGEYKIYGATGALKGINFYREEYPYIAIVKDGAGVGRLFLCKEMTSVLGTLGIIKSSKQASLKFLYYTLSTVDFSKYITGSTIPHIYFKDYSNETIGLPKLPEQQKIANFLSSIDSKIDIESQVLQKLEEQKKFLLQNLFI